jgi:hypothetical protein
MAKPPKRHSRTKEQEDAGSNTKNMWSHFVLEVIPRSLAAAVAEIVRALL